MHDVFVLPDDLDPELWFPCRHNPHTRDYLGNHRWHTFPGRMAAYCPARQASFRVSRAELPSDLPLATRYWVEGFLAGNMPRQPDAEDDGDPAIRHWEIVRDTYFETGYWPQGETPSDE